MNVISFPYEFRVFAKRLQIEFSCTVSMWLSLRCVSYLTEDWQQGMVNLFTDSAEDETETTKKLVSSTACGWLLLLMVCEQLLKSTKSTHRTHNDFCQLTYTDHLRAHTEELRHKQEVLSSFRNHQNQAAVCTEWETHLWCVHGFMEVCCVPH